MINRVYHPNPSDELDERLYELITSPEIDSELRESRKNAEKIREELKQPEWSEELWLRRNTPMTI
jgi:hypothetical protein